MILETIGWIGAFCVLWAYFLISTGKVTNKSILFQWFNFIGAFLLIIYTITVKAYPSAFVNLVWLIIAVVGIVKLYKK